jgi:divalent metal cation (Fe/Co/Zn/Cd) transporter
MQASKFGNPAGIEGIIANAPMQPTSEAAFVLGAAFIIDGYVLHRAAKEIVSRASGKAAADPRLMEEFQLKNAYEYVTVRAKAMYQFMRKTRDPFMAAVFMEDLTACSGVLVAAGGISMAYATGNPMWDHGASILIGGMLGVVAIRLVNLNKAYLVGQAVDSGKAV